MTKKILFFLFAWFFSQSVFAATGLKDYVPPARLYVGAAVASGPLKNFNEPLYSGTLAAEYNMITNENEMKWSFIHPDRYRYDFSQADAAVAFAAAHGMKVRGHTLLWKDQNPSWLNNGYFSADQLKTILIDHINTVMGHYKTKYTGTVIYWDVVNEIINAGMGAWAPLGGSGDQVTQAFNISAIALRAARAADPAAKLCLNEYSMEYNAAGTKTYQLVKRLKEAGVPLDCVGFQGHLGGGNVSKEQWIASLTAFTQLGLEVQITEFDKPYASADQYANAIRACLAVPQCSAFVTWGFTDKYTWLGTHQAPLPFGTGYEKKPAYYALKTALAEQGGTPTPTPTPVSTGIAVNVGGQSLKDPSGTNWLADTGFSGGTTNKTTKMIRGASLQALYQSYRFGNFSYHFNVTNGNYKVSLKFVEPYWSASNKRIFNVNLNGMPVVQNLDVYAAAGGAFAALDRTYYVYVANGKIDLQFQSIVNNAIVSAIDIVRQ